MLCNAGAGLMSSRAPLIPSYCEPEWGHLLERCWEPIPQNRCSLRDLAESLQRIIDEIEVEQQVSITHCSRAWSWLRNSRPVELLLYVFLLGEAPTQKLCCSRGVECGSFETLE